MTEEIKEEAYPKRLEGDRDGHEWIRESDDNMFYSSGIYICAKCSVKTRFPFDQIEKIKNIKPNETWSSALSNHNYNCDNCLIQNVLE